MKTLGLIFGSLSLVFGGIALIHFQQPIKEVFNETRDEKNLSFLQVGEPRNLID